MKKIVFAALVGIIIVAPQAFAGEEIQLAAAIGSSSPTATTSSDEGGAGAAPEAVRGGAPSPPPPVVGMSTPTMVAIGVIGAGLIAAISAKSTSSH